MAGQPCPFLPPQLFREWCPFLLDLTSFLEGGQRKQRSFIAANRGGIGDFTVDCVGDQKDARVLGKGFGWPVWVGGELVEEGRREAIKIEELWVGMVGRRV